MILKAYHDLITDNTDLTDDLASYTVGSDTTPAVFTIDPIPEDAPLPAVRITMVGPGLGGGTKAKKGGTLFVDIAVFVDKTESKATAEDIAWKLWSILERGEIEIEDYDSAAVIADLPVDISDPDGFPGYLVSTQCLFLEE